MDTNKRLQWVYLPLKLEDNRRLYIYGNKLDILKEELESFLANNNYMMDKEFSKKILFSQEIKFNNEIEGYNDDVEIINEIVTNEKDKGITSLERRRRIVNLYRGYKYILDNHDINKDNLRKLYGILSKGLLSKEDEQAMDFYYRLNKVYIQFSNNIQVPPAHRV